MRRRAPPKCRLPGATLHFRGYPTQIEGKSPGDLDYDYDRVSLTGPFQHQRGNYTRIGDVTSLVTGIDDRFAIFGSGEEIAAEFDATKLPALPPHWKRDYFFYANGFVKDMDWWDGSPFTVAQLPFHGMSHLPVSANRNNIPDDAESLDYQLNWNDRFDSGEPVRSYHFNYRQTSVHSGRRRQSHNAKAVIATNAPCPILSRCLRKGGRPQKPRRKSP